MCEIHVKCMTLGRDGIELGLSFRIWMNLLSQDRNVACSIISVYEVNVRICFSSVWALGKCSLVYPVGLGKIGFLPL